jgi:ABC-type uncharacterized transport system permease subunit
MMIVLLSIIGATAGAVWALIPALMKAFARTDEIVVTLMLNYVASSGSITSFTAPGKIRKDMVSPERRLSQPGKTSLFF